MSRSCGPGGCVSNFWVARCEISCGGSGGGEAYHTSNFAGTSGRGRGGGLMTPRLPAPASVWANKPLPTPLVAAKERLPSVSIVPCDVAGPRLKSYSTVDGNQGLVAVPRMVGAAGQIVARLCLGRKLDRSLHKAKTGIQESQQPRKRVLAGTCFWFGDSLSGSSFALAVMLKSRRSKKDTLAPRPREVLSAVAVCCHAVEQAESFQA